MKNPSRIDQKQSNKPDCFIQSTHAKEDGKIVHKKNHTLDTQADEGRSDV